MSRRLPRAPASKQTPEDVVSSPGHPLDPGSRAEMEARFGRDFSSVRIHTDARAAESAEAVSAHAYTVGPHVVFGPGRFVPNTREGRHLLAHELTHTIQQSGQRSLQRQAAAGAVDTPAEAEAERTADQVTALPAGFIVDDDAATVAPGQMRRGEFLSEVTRAACAAADVVMAGAGQSTEGCPYVDDALARAQRMSTSQLETAVRRFIDPEGVTSAADYIPRIGSRVAEGVLRYLLTGDTSAVPADLASAPGEEAVAPAMQFKREGSGDATASDANRAASQLGRGTPLEGPVRTRMEHAFGFDFSRVRIHTDARAAGASSALSARAFTIGNDVAFAGNEYHPNTPIGDALLAHELAHVVQQNGGVHAKGGTSDALDDDADRSAVGAVMRLWTGAKDVAASAMPRLRSGLQLQRCKTDRTPAPTPTTSISQYDDTDPLHDPSRLTDAQVEATDEYRAYLAMNPVPAPGRTVTVDEARMASRLLLRHMRQTSGTVAVTPQVLQDWLTRARSRLSVATAAEAQQGRLHWVRSGGDQVADPANAMSEFTRWVMAGGNQPDPQTGRLNCYEMVLFSAYQARQISEARLRDIHRQASDAMTASGDAMAFPRTLERLIRSSNEQVYNPASANTARPLRGDIISFDMIANHAALATGRMVNGEIQIVSHWPPPDGDHHTKLTTIEALLREMGGSHTVRFYSPVW